MATKLFVNLPVKDLGRSKAFLKSVTHCRTTPAGFQQK